MGCDMNSNTKEILDNEILNAFDKLLPYMPHLFEDEVFFVITDRVKFLKVVFSPNLQPKIKIGDPVPPGAAIYEAMRQGQPVIKVVDESVFGLTFNAIAIPVKDERGYVTGGIGIGRSLKASSSDQ